MTHLRKLAPWMIAVALSSAVSAVPLPVTESQAQAPPAIAEPATSALEADPVCTEKMKTLPETARQTYAEIPIDAKRLLDDTLKQETALIPGVVTINHHDAFVRGEYMKHNVFDFVNERIEKMIKDGKLKAEMGPPLHKFFDLARNLTPDQRDALTVLVSREVELTRS